MNTKGYGLVLAGLLVVALVLVGTVSAGTVTINPGQSIATAITNAGSGGIVILNPGTYYQSDIMVGNAITIQANTSYGHGPWDTIIDGSSSGTSIFVNGYSLAIDNLTFENGNTLDGGAAIYNDRGTLSITSSAFTDCTSGGGSAIFNNRGTLSIISSTFSKCTATNKDGGAIYNDGGTITSISSSTFANCSASNGGAIYNEVGGTSSGGKINGITSSIFSGCTAANGEGGVIFNHGTITSITSSTFTGCTSLAGGAIYNVDTITSVTTSTFTNCTGDIGGGAIYNEDTITSINSSTFTGCTDFGSFGGGAIYNAGTLSITFSTFSGCKNTAGVGGGAINSIRLGIVTADNNWWGTNSYPDSSRLIGISPTSWLVLGITSPSAMIEYRTYQVQANLTYNMSSSGDSYDASGLGQVPDGIPVAFGFSGVTGSLQPSAGNMTSGANTTTFTPTEVGPATVSAEVDGFSVQQPITVSSPPAPTVSSISPTTGPEAGSTSVTITGTDFIGTTAVNFGSAAALSFSVINDTSITTTSPAGSGTVDITITNTGGTSATSAADQFMYAAALPPAPTVTVVSPNRGSTGGNTAVTISGTNFMSGATTVSFGSTVATNVVVVNPNTITATSPADTGNVDVTVTTPGGTSAISLADHFTYISFPIASFTSNITAGTAPLAVQFNDTSDAFEPLMWNWSLGNNYWFNTTDIILRNASYTYINPGTYTVSLTVTNVSGSTTATETGYIHVTGAGQPTASFSGVPTTGTAPLMVTFADSSLITGGEMWNWSFGDNSWSNTTVSSSPVHTYSSEGTYTVSLTVTNTTGSDTRTRPGYIIVNAAGTPATTTTMPVQQSNGGSRSDYWGQSGNSGDNGYTGPEPTRGSFNPAPQQPATGSQPPGSPGSSSSAPAPAASSGTGSSSGGVPVISVVEGVAGIGVFTGGGFMVRRWWIQRQNPALFRKYK